MYCVWFLQLQSCVRLCQRIVHTLTPESVFSSGHRHAGRCSAETSLSWANHLLGGPDSLFAGAHKCAFRFLYQCSLSCEHAAGGQCNTKLCMKLNRNRLTVVKVTPQVSRGGNKLPCLIESTWKLHLSTSEDIVLKYDLGIQVIQGTNKDSPPRQLLNLMFRLFYFSVKYQNYQN